MKILYCVALGASLLLVGCNRTVREMEVEQKTLSLDVPIQVQPAGANLDFFSPNGAFYVVSNYEESIWWFEVRSYDGKVKMRKEGTSCKVIVPQLFMAKVPRVICASFDENDAGFVSFIALDWVTKQEKPIFKIPEAEATVAYLSNDLRYRNQQHDAIFVGQYILRATGQAQPVPQFAEFLGWTGAGDLVIKQDSQFFAIKQDGKSAPLSENPLIGQTGQQKGKLKLESKQSNVDFKSGSALVGMLWLSKESDDKNREEVSSILVGAGYDLQDFGFVPNHDAIYFSASGSSFVVPYHSKRAEN